MTTRRTPNKTHAKYESKCGLDDVIELLFPELKGKAVIDGKAFPCPICGPTHPQKIKITSGKINTKPYWNCTAKHDAKSCDTLDFIRMSMRMKYADAVTIWAALANSDPSKWQSIIEDERPNWYLLQGESKWTDQALDQGESDKLTDACAKDEQRSYFKPNPLDEALGKYKEAIEAASELKDREAQELFAALKSSLERDDAA
jgi:hypothetical protein